jgi:hypothetical protein
LVHVMKVTVQVEFLILFKNSFLMFENILKFL